MANRTESSDGLRVVGLLAGIGRVERGLARAGHTPGLVCATMEPAQGVLRDAFPDVPIHPDVRTLKTLPDAELVTAGFPCQDLSQAGKTAGINGRQSGLVAEV